MEPNDAEKAMVAWWEDTWIPDRERSAFLAGYRVGQEAMREKCAAVCDELGGNEFTSFEEWECADAIREIET